MDDVTVTMSRKLWVDLLIDLDDYAQHLDGDGRELEPGSYEIERQLSYEGVTL